MPAGISGSMPASNGRKAECDRLYELEGGVVKDFCVTELVDTRSTSRNHPPLPAVDIRALTSRVKPSCTSGSSETNELETPSAFPG